MKCYLETLYLKFQHTKELLVWFFPVCFFCNKKISCICDYSNLRENVNYKSDECVYFKQALLGGFESQKQAKVVAILFQVWVFHEQKVLIKYTFQTHNEAGTGASQK